MRRDAKTKRIRWIVLGELIVLAALSFLAVCLRPNGWVASLVRLTHATWARPAIFGPYHLIMLGLCLGLMVAVALLYRKFPEDKLDSLLFWAGVSLFLLELYKQLYYLVVLTGGRYNFGILPLQFCSYSLYLYLILPLLPAGKIKDALLDFAALYQTMGACIVMGYPTLYEEIPLQLLQPQGILLAAIFHRQQLLLLQAAQQAIPQKHLLCPVKLKCPAIRHR